jgi:murein DD-endopeptidase MepM/ murein hydrolase activator NlpD
MTVITTKRSHFSIRSTTLVLLTLCFLTMCGSTMSGTALAQPRGPRFTWPLSPEPAVTRGFQAPDGPFAPGHRGVDLAATPGQEVLAAGPGVVVFAGTLAGRGVVAIEHDGDLRTTYEPLVSAVAVGDQVYAGQVLGTVLAGHPECTAAACLHWGVRHGDEYVDPLTLITFDTEIRLKPWDGSEPSKPTVGVP